MSSWSCRKRTIVGASRSQEPMDSDSEGAARSAPRPSPLQAEKIRHAARSNAPARLIFLRSSGHVASTGTSKAVA